MRITYHRPGAAKSEVFVPSGQIVRIGRGSHNDLVLDSPFVPAEAARIELAGATWVLTPLPLARVTVSGRRLPPGESLTISEPQTIQIFPVDLVIQPEQVNAEDESDRQHAVREQLLNGITAKIHTQLLAERELAASLRRITEARKDEKPILETDLQQLEDAVDEFVRQALESMPEPQALVDFAAGTCVRTQLLSIVSGSGLTSSSEQTDPAEGWRRLLTQVPLHESEFTELAQQCLDELHIKDESDLSAAVRKVQTGFWPSWVQRMTRLRADFRRYLANRFFKKELKDIICGLGPLEDLLRLPSVSEIMVVDCNRVYIEQYGRVEDSGRRFVSDKSIEDVINRIIRKVGRAVNESTPLVDARLPDGSRVNAVIKPLAVSGPSLTIRRFPDKRLHLEDLVSLKAISSSAAAFMKACVLAKKNIIVSGGTGSGKTTLLNCLADLISRRERIVTIEDTAELQISGEQCVRLESRRRSLEGQGSYSIGDLLKNALRMRPDRIIVGECRGAEALDMLQAMNTGHSGSMTTIHANGTQDVIRRLEVLVQMDKEVKLPVSSIYRQIVSGVDVILQLSRMSDGSRRVTEISEVTAIDNVSGEPHLRDLFKIRSTPDGAQLRPTGHLPTFVEQLLEKNFLELSALYAGHPSQVKPI